ncbi:MAG: VOC family protein [Calditrichaeota bacterium]|nr:VOC family protein [Calditrichota bacterium]MCB0304642.1 VOC family protein [Calditrichota bacterium]MCB9087926.1 VOC family protein [Calditrichia bacterium]
MTQSIFINLPVKDLARSTQFFKSLGFTLVPQFSDETAGCLKVGDNIYVMLLIESRFREFTQKPVSDARKQTEVLLALEVESREAVKDLVEKALAAGGSLYLEPQEHGWMFSHSFADLDGHQWEVFWMDTDAMPE